MNRSIVSRGRRAWLAVGVLALAACRGSTAIPAEMASPAGPPRPFTAGEALKEFDAEPDPSYRLGEGDALTIQVWDRPELSGSQFVGPDGVITVPVAGPLRVSGMTREEATKAVRESLGRFYAGVTVTLRVDQYASNRVMILGRVARPGLIQFDRPPTLLEAVARAGGLVQEPRQVLTHCAVVRGRDRVAWLDLRRLLEEGDLALNLRLKPNDFIYVPDWEDLPVYVLGQVARPGPYRWSPGMSFMDALAQAGGPTRDAAPSQIVLIRPGEGVRATISLDALMAPEAALNLALKRGDILYVPTNGLADFGYIVEKMNPFSWVFIARSVPR